LNPNVAAKPGGNREAAQRRDRSISTLTGLIRQYHDRY
jgi:transposase